MQEVTVNLVPVLVAALIPMVVGFVWYGPLFGKPWMKLVGISKKDIEAQKDKMGKTYAMMFVSALVMSYVLAFVLSFAETTTVMAGVQGAFWMWLGFIASVKLSDVLFNGKPWNLYYIEVGYYLVSLLLMGGLLGIWR